MNFTKQTMLEIIRNQLALDMNCTPQDFLNDGVLFCESKLNDGRRMFDRQTPYLEIATMGKGTVVSGDSEILSKVKPILEDKLKDDIFSAPFIYSHSLYYIPDLTIIAKLPCPDGFTLEVKEGKEIHSLYKTKGFHYAIQYDVDHPRPDALAVCAMKDGQVVGIAGCSADSKTMWQIGIDVLPAYRAAKLASCLVTQLTFMVMQRGILPYYGTSPSNIPSQTVAHRSGFMPAWMCTYKNTLDGKSPYQEIDHD